MTMIAEITRSIMISKVTTLMREDKIILKAISGEMFTAKIQSYLVSSSSLHLIHSFLRVVSLKLKYTI